jgi:Mycotoxin biosynthesis protein UstYa
MCFSDISPVVWQWSEELHKLEQRDDVLHTCKDFDRIVGWAKERQYDSEV